MLAVGPGAKSPGGGKGTGTSAADGPLRYPGRLCADALLALLGGVVLLLRT